MQKRSKLKIFYSYIDSEQWSFEDERLYANAPPLLQNRLGAKPTKRRWQSLKGWWLLSKALGVDLSALQNIYFGEKGKPYFDNGPFFNISNTKNLVVVALANEGIEVGIDIEQIRSPRPLIYPKVFTEEERVNIDGAEKFTEMWTRKEAVVKLFGGGIPMGFLNFNVLKDKVYAFEHHVYLQKIQIDNHIGALATFSDDAAFELFEV